MTTSNEMYETQRGFLRSPLIFGTYRDTVQVYESSAATRPCIWVKVMDSQGQAHVHLPLSEAKYLRDCLSELIERHYQNE